MKGYKFSLNRVLDVRIIEEKMAQNRLLEERQKANLIKGELKELNHNQEGLYTYLRDNIVVNKDTLQARTYLYRQREEINQVEEKLKGQLERVADSNQEFIEKKKNKEILEKLKEKEYQRYYKELLKKEQQFIDELSLQVRER